MKPSLLHPVIKNDSVINRLHTAIAKANEERLALENAAQCNLKEMETAIMNKVETMDKLMQKLKISNAAMEATVQTLHEGQLMMDNNIKMLMIKLGIQTGSAIKKVNKI